MKTIQNLIGLLAGLAVLLTFTARAALSDPVNGFAQGTTNAGTALSYVIVSPRTTLEGAAPRVQYLNAASDKAGSAVQFYRVTSQITATYTNSTTTLPVNTTNTGVNWRSGTVIVRHLADDSYEKRTLTNNTGSTNVVVTAAPLGTVLPGDILYYAVTSGAGTINWGASTNSLGPTAGGIYIGQKAKPLLLEIDATTYGALNVVSGDYVR